MGKTPCSKGIIVSNATSVSINATIKKSGASPLTPLHIDGEENAIADIPSRLFGSNLSWFCKNYTDLLNVFNRIFPFPNQASWNVFSPSNAVSMKVISLMRMQHFEMGGWLQLEKAGKIVGKLLFLCQTFGSGVLATGCQVLAARLVPHSLRRLHTPGPLWSRKTSCSCHSLWGALGRWRDGSFGL